MIVIDLPPPISVNRIWRAHKAGKTRVLISPEYARWKTEADKLVMAMGTFRGLKCVRTKFEVDIIVKRRNADVDNFSKGILDWLQSRGVVENDKNCEQLTIKWGDAPSGCRVTVKPIISSVGDVLNRVEAPTIA